MYAACALCMYCQCMIQRFHWTNCTAPMGVLESISKLFISVVTLARHQAATSNITYRIYKQTTDSQD